MRQRIGIHTIKILEIEEVPDDPLREHFEGTLLIEGEKWRFGTDIEEINQDRMYSAVCEWRETPYGDPIVQIHELDKQYGEIEIEIR